MSGIIGALLIFSFTLLGCDNGTTISPQSYTVSFDPGEGGGTAPVNQTIEEGKSITLPGAGNMTAPTGKEFDGWKVGGTPYAAAVQYTVTANITFIAQWKTTATTNPLLGTMGYGCQSAL